MFHPQPTPFPSFAPYGVSSSTSTPQYPAFPAVGSGALVVDSGGPTYVRDPIFSPVNHPASSGVSVSGAALAFGGSSYNNNKMAEHDMEAQEALARDFQPALEVSKLALDPCATVVERGGETERRRVLTLGQGPLVGEKRSSHAITEEYAKADPVYVTKTAVSRKMRGRQERKATWRTCADGSTGAAAEVLTLSADPGRWELWMAGYVLHTGIPRSL